ncbi:hypothetical protein ACHQM5_001083 [Ranunculus cassubicifolius]
MVESSSSNSQIVMPTISGFKTVKLDHSNYLLWLTQIVLILKSKNLMGYVDGTKPIPAASKADKDGKPTTDDNPDHLLWVQQDQLILSWINNTLTLPVLSTVARCKTSETAWKSLERRYASTSQNRIQQLLGTLHQTKGNNMSVSDYIDAVTAIADSLALAGQAVPDEQLVTIIMNNIGPKFEVTVSSAQARDTPIGLDDLVALLLSAEQRLNTSVSMSDSMIESPRTTLYAPKQSSQYPRGRGSFSRGNSRGVLELIHRSDTGISSGSLLDLCFI